MSLITIEGPTKLRGELRVQGAKNSTLPLLAASVVCRGQTVLHSCPKLSDVDSAIKILSNLGCVCRREGSTLTVDSTAVKACEIPHELMREMRSSIVFLGAIVSRLGEARLSFPGGCELGARPIDLHLSALRRMGVQIDECHGCLCCTAPKGIEGDYIHLSFPSVGATENIILAAATARGTTVVENAAREPEIVDLAEYLNKCGAKIYGAGESSIVIEGVESLQATEHTVMPDRIVAATYMAAVAITGGELLLKNCPQSGLKTMLPIFEECGCRILCDSGNLYLCAPERLKSVGRVRTMPYPGFPTDAQAPVMAMATLGEGTSVFVENIFESRYKHAGELIRLGAKINIEGKVAVIEGVERLSGAPLEARELRGGASLVAAGLAAWGRTTVSGTEYIDRGYEDIVLSLKQLGANISRT